MSGHELDTRAQRKNELTVKPEQEAKDGVDVRGAPHSIIYSRAAVLIHNAGDPVWMEARPGPRRLQLQHIHAIYALCFRSPFENDCFLHLR